MTGLSGVEGLSQLKVLNLANTAIVTESLMCCRHCPSLAALNVANTVNVNGDQALRYLAGKFTAIASLSIKQAGIYTVK